jgi:putative flippase GtrA
MPVAESTRARARAEKRAARGERFTAVMTAIVGRFPFGLARVIPPYMLGFGIISGTAFVIDLGLLTVLHGGLRWPVWLSISLSYASVSGLSYLLNRSLNFRSHAAIGPQFTVYAGVVAVNYLAWILGVGAGLAALGVNYQLARIAAAACEAVYMYIAMRWLVFRDAQRPVSPAPPGEGEWTDPSSPD